MKNKLLHLLFCCFLTLVIPEYLWAISAQLNINSANKKELMELPYIGKKKAAAIILFRRQHGSFQQFEDLLLIDEIGVKTFEAIRPYLLLKDSSSLNNDKNIFRLRKK